MENENKSAYRAAQHFSAKYNYCFSEKLFQNWNKNKDGIRETHSTKKRAIGGGQKPTLEELKHLLADEIIELRISKYKVTKAFIADRARMLAAENRKEGFKASNRWLIGFMDRFDFSLRRTTNLTTLTDDQLVGRAVDYMTYLHAKLPLINLSKTLLMDETAVYFEDGRTQTVDIKGRRHVVLKSTVMCDMVCTQRQHGVMLVFSIYVC
jgi:hypothetical protein